MSDPRQNTTQDERDREVAQGGQNIGTCPNNPKHNDCVVIALPAGLWCRRCNCYVRLR